MVPLHDGGGLLGQVLSGEPAVLNSVSCALFDQCAHPRECPVPDPARLFSTLLTTRDLLDAGVWRVVGSHPVRVPRERFPFEALRTSGFVGARVVGSANVGEFANAFRGLVPWDDWADPDYLDRLLISPEMKPAKVLRKAR